MARGQARVRRGVIAAVAAACALALFSGCTAAPDPVRGYDQAEGGFAPEIAEQLDATLAEAVRLSGSSGAVAGVWAPWAGSWTTGQGTVDPAEGAAEVTTDTRFRLATTTGAVTCALMLRLVDAGVVELDDEVGSLVRGIPGLDGITLEDLCRHRSGIADYYPSLERFVIGNPAREWAQGELIASGMASERRFAPGDGWSESRSGILLLTAALEQRTGRTWSELVEQYVAEPLGLESTALPSPSVLEPEGALGGSTAALGSDGAPDCATRVDVSAASSSIGGAASGALSTLEDARRFSEAYANGSLFSESLARKVWTVEPLGGDAPGWQGQGIGAKQYGPMRGLAGETVGALTAVFTEPETGLTVVVALNDSTSGAAFVREAAFALASIAAKAVAEGEESPPFIELPWSAEQALERMTAAAACPPPAEGEEGAAAEEGAASAEQPSDG